MVNTDRWKHLGLGVQGQVSQLVYPTLDEGFQQTFPWSTAIDECLCPPKSYVEILTVSVMMLGGGVFMGD